MKKELIYAILGIIIGILLGLYVLPGILKKDASDEDDKGIPLYLQYNFKIDPADSAQFIFKIKFESKDAIAGTGEYDITSNTLFKVHTKGGVLTTQTVKITAKAISRTTGQSEDVDIETDKVKLGSNGALQGRGCSIESGYKKSDGNVQSNDHIKTKINGPIGISPIPPNPTVIIVE